MPPLYQRRWKVEESHKLLIKNVLMGNLLTQNLITQMNHFGAAGLTSAKPKSLKLKCGFAHFLLKAQFHDVGLKVRY